MYQKKLLKIAQVIESYIDVIKSLEQLEPEKPLLIQAQQQVKLAPVNYANDLDLLFNKSKFKTIIDKQTRLQSAKIVNAAKNLIKDFNDYGLNAYADFFENSLNNINALNGNSNLAPIKENILFTIKKDIEGFQLNAQYFYEDLLNVIFQVGRQHQEITGFKKEARLNVKKYMTVTAAENNKFKKLNTLMQNDLKQVLAELNTQLIKKIESHFVFSSHKNTIVNDLAKTYSKFAYQIDDVYRKHCWRTYQVGNLHQLALDGTTMVKWHTGHYADDCICCRAYETGDSLLCTANGTVLPHQRDIDQVNYYLKDILAMIEYDGPSIMAHDGCRCYLVAVN